MPFVPVSSILWGIWGLLQVELSPVGFGFAVSSLNEFKITKKAGLLKVRLPEYLFVRTELQQLLTKYGFFRHLDHLIQLYLHYNYQSAQYHNLHQPVNGSTTLPRRPD